MKEILGNKLEAAFEFFGISAVKTHQSSNDKTDFAQVWELDNDILENFNNISDKEWTKDFGWYRYAEGSNMGEVSKRYNINNHYIMAWDGYGREDEEKENKELPPEYRIHTPRKYNDLLEYFCEELGASTERNVTALAIDLAKQNGIKMSELFKKYQDN